MTNEKATPENTVKLSECLRFAEEVVDWLQEAGCDAFEAREVLMLAWQSQESRIERVAGEASRQVDFYEQQATSYPETARRKATRRKLYFQSLREARQAEDELEKRVAGAVDTTVAFTLRSVEERIADASDHPRTAEVNGGTE